MFEAKNTHSPLDEPDADLRELIRLGIIEPAVTEDGRPGYRFAGALFSPDYAPNDALLARMVARRREKRGDTPAAHPLKRSTGRAGGSRGR